MAEQGLKLRLLAIAGLVIGVMIWPTFGAFIDTLMEFRHEDPAEQARMVAEQRLIAKTSVAMLLILVPLAAWIAGRTHHVHKVLSLLTLTSVFGLITVVAGLVILD